MKTSYFSISVPVLKQNFRKLWLLPLLAFLAYFIVSGYVILSDYNKFDTIDPSFIEMILTHNSEYISLLHLVLPILCAVVIFRYLHSPGTMTVIHAMPLTRRSLFLTQTLSGWIMTVLPVLLNGLLLLCLAKPIFQKDGPMYFTLPENADPGTFDLFSHGHVLTWLWQSLLLVTLVYLIAVLAGMITGNILMHLFTGFFLNLFPAGLVFCCDLYASSFLYGYESPFYQGSSIFSISPFFGVIYCNGQMSVWLIVSYIILAILLLLLCCFLYEKRSLERTSQSLVFRGLEPLICIIATFLGMSLFGFLLDQNTESYGVSNSFYRGLLLGAVVSFLAVRMIIKRTLRIFNPASLKVFTVYCIIAVLFVGSLALDVTGYETRIPGLAEIKTASFDFTYLNGDYTRFYGDYYQEKGAPNTEMPGVATYSSEDTLKGIRTVHWDLVKNAKKEQPAPPMTFDVIYSTMNFSYQLHSGSSVNRYYDLKPNEVVRLSDGLKQIYESAEFKSKFSWKNLQLDQTAAMTLSCPWPEKDETELYPQSSPVLTGKKLQALLDCMEKDFQASSYEDYSDTRMPVALCSLEFNKKTKFHSGSGSSETTMDSIDTKVKQTDRHTIRWLKENGYAEMLKPRIDPGASRSVTVSRLSTESYYAVLERDDIESWGENDLDAMYTDHTTVKKQSDIQEIAKNCQLQPAEYVCEFNNGDDRSALTKVYISEKNLPDFLRKQLERKDR